ncbi:acyltransferase family protein [Bradyrhizobium sp. cf659]|uniref:acyltransferase family protein n=1 Tax=Bradyrhizobium sp. cf659 TaxID=1761771 RepID=UPI0008F10AE5|nr:acyltransferase [Bradyrhizobium sp. cf659]SFJ64896.1 Peptidoglycan/LPS O-acetylase OafA/YrhL, contains acyltransferase and SGNH-hydrolase domains [Bradyrhizobium sp. cf659]
MFSLDRTKNDSSALLDLLRALAAQMVCVGHTWNLTFASFGGAQQTLVPDIGVLLFFVLSGFVIAFTLHDRTKADDYSLLNYVVERFARIYCAYAPALVVIAALDYIAVALGIAWFQLDGTASFLRNLLMLQGYPGALGGGTFGSAGQLNTIAIEFHIYFFVGGLFFFCKGRNQIAGLVLAIAAAAAPIFHFAERANASHSLFVLWLLGFGGYFVAISMKMNRMTTVACAILSVLLFWQWRVAHVRGDEAALAAQPYFALWFVSIVIAAQGQQWLLRLQPVIGFFANYSYSLYLIHFTIVKIIAWLMPSPLWFSFVVAIVISNLVAWLFASMTESRHKQLARWMLRWLAPVRLRFSWGR